MLKNDKFLELINNSKLKLELKIAFDVIRSKFIVSIIFDLFNNLAVFWNSWSKWTSCSSTCGTGKRFRVRSCSGGVIIQGGCLGKVMENKECQLKPCLEGKFLTTGY